MLHRDERRVIARLDRLPRHLTTQEAILAEAWRAGADVHTADYGEVQRDDPDDPMRRALRQIVGMLSELDRAMTVKRLRDGRRAKARQSGKPCGRYPFGESKAGPVGREQHVLLVIRGLRGNGHTWQSVADELNRRGAAFAPRDSAAWTGRKLHKVAAR